MKMTRTQFVSAFATAAAATFLDPGELLAAITRTPTVPAGLTAATFQPHVNTSFYSRRDRDGLMIELVLTEVVVKSSAGPSEQFTLLLLAVNGALSEGTYTLEHRALGKLQLFLVPAGETKAGTQYRADFNNLRKIAPRQP